MNNKLKLVTTLAILFFIFNLLLLFFINKKGSMKGHNPDRNKHIIIEKLHLDDAQIIKYDSLIKIHREGMHPAKRKLLALENTLYFNINNPYNEQVNDSLIAAINNVQKEIEYIHIRHFNDIKNLCRPEQLNDFKQLTMELASIFSAPFPPPKRR
jgi:hypothetical protein